MNQRQLITVLGGEIQKVEDRCPGYRGALLDHLAEIVMRERENRTHRTNIQQKVTDQCQALGDFLAGKLKRAEASGVSKDKGGQGAEK